MLKSPIYGILLGNKKRRKGVGMGRKSLGILTFSILFLLLSCAKVVDKREFKLTERKTYAVIPFENYTDTPLAGYRVAHILEGVLRAKGYKVADRVWEYSEEEPTKEKIREILNKASQTADYIITGSVNEFRYKTGIDGEPAVSISVFLIDASTGRVIRGSSLSASGWAHESLGTVTQDLIRDLLD